MVAMRNRMRIVGLGALACVVLVVWGLYWWIDVEKFKPLIVSAVHDATGRSLTIAGGMELEVFPRLTLRATEAELGNAEGFHGPFLTLAGLELQVRLMPLLSARLEVEAVEMNGLALHLVTDRNGRNNWDDLVAAWDPSENPSAAADNASLPDQSSPSRGSALAALIVDGLEVSEARIAWTDQRHESAVSLEKAALSLSGFSLGAPFDVRLGGQLMLPAQDTVLDVDLEAEGAMTGHDFSLKNVGAKLLVSGRTVAGEQEALDLSLAEFSSAGTVKNLRLQGLGLDLAAEAAPGGQGPQGRLRIAPFNPSAVLGRIGLNLPALADAAALTRVGSSFDWAMSGNKLQISNLVLNIDNSTLQGELDLAMADRPSVVFDLHMDALDADRYRPLATRDEPTAEVGVGDPADNDRPRHWTTTLRGLDVDGTLAVDALRVASARLTNVRLGLEGRSGLFHLHDFQAQAYDGRITAQGTADLDQETPRFSWSHDLSALQVGPLLRDVYGREVLSGTAASVVSVQVAGLDVRSWKQSLGGTVRFRVMDGQLHGLNIPAMLRDEIRKLKGQSAGGGDSLATRFSELSGSSTITNGVEESRNLLLQAPRFRMDGAGRADLIRETLDYHVVITLQGTQGRFEETMPGLHRIPLKISGPFSGPVVSVDTPALLRGLGTQGGRTVQDTLRGLGSGLNQGAQGILRPLLR